MNITNFTPYSKGKITLSERRLLIKRSFVKAVVPTLASILIKALHKTIRWKFYGLENIKDIKTPIIFAFFHGRMAMLHFLYEKIRRDNSGLKMILSPHFDGELGAKIIKKFGIDNIVGSSSKKSLQLLRNIAKLENFDIAITPDGPRGPNEKVKTGVIYISKIKNYPIVPVVYSVNRYKILNSWDNFMIPFPFAKGVYLMGEPFYVPNDTPPDDFDKYAAELEKKMKMLKTQADLLVQGC